MQGKIRIILATLPGALMYAQASGETPADLARVLFRVGSSQFNPALGDNKAAMDNFIELVRSAQAANEIDSIVVRACAYPDNRYNIPAVYFAVGDDGEILTRLYKTDGEYYTTDDGNENSRYTGDADMIRSFCRAALPVAAKWEADKIYTYKLNYTNGIGWHDPYDPIPGEPIINGKVTFDVKVSDWKEGVKTDVTVPRK